MAGQAVLVLCLLMATVTISQEEFAMPQNGADPLYPLSVLVTTPHQNSIPLSVGTMGPESVGSVAATEDSIDCGPACDHRCSKASRAKLCLRYCNICCQRCNCVPPGTADNKDVCPCYANMMSSKGTPKCP